MLIKIGIILLSLAASASILWVYYDATNNRIGKIRRGGLFSFSAGEWASYCLLLWFVFFPLYLYKRKYLIEKAQSDPIEVSNTKIKLGVLGVFSFILIIIPALNIDSSDFTFSSSDAYVFEEIEDKMNGNKVMATKEEISSDGLFYTKLSLICDIKNKNLNFDLTSYESPKGKDNNLQSLKLVTADEFLVGKIKFDTSNPSSNTISLRTLQEYNQSIDSSKFNNLFSFNISLQRNLSNLLSKALDDKEYMTFVNSAKALMISPEGKRMAAGGAVVGGRIEKLIPGLDIANATQVSYWLINSLSSVTDDMTQLNIAAKNSISGADFLENLGKDILIEYQNEHGVVQVNFSLNESEVKKVINACRVEAPKDVKAVAPIIEKPKFIIPAEVVSAPLQTYFPIQEDSGGRYNTNKFILIYYALCKCEVNYEQIAQTVSYEYRDEKDIFKKKDILNYLKPLVDKDMTYIRAKRMVVFPVSLDYNLLKEYNFDLKSFPFSQNIALFPPLMSKPINGLEEGGLGIRITNNNDFNDGIQVPNENQARLIEEKRAKRGVMIIKVYAYVENVGIEKIESLNNQDTLIVELNVVRLGLEGEPSSPLIAEPVLTAPVVAEPVPTTPVVAEPITWAPSFDCTKASTGAERLICNSRELSEIDVKMSQVFKKEINSSVDKTPLKDSQRKWRKNTRDACSDSSCMLKAYQTRIDEISIH